MTDTPDFIRKKQIEIILSKTPEERALLAADMIDSVYEIVKSSIKKEKPGLSKRELAAEIFRRYYKCDFTSEQLDEISKNILSSNDSRNKLHDNKKTSKR